MKKPGFRARLARWIVLSLFVASGFSALVYEVVWVRSLTTVFGVGAYAISTVLAGYMGGLALGAWVFGRFIDRSSRPLAVYGWLEAGIGAYALAMPLLFFGADAVLRAIYPATGGEGSALLLTLRVVLAFAILAVPTTLMGATLPVLCKFFVESLDRVGREAGRLYFLNTMGAVSGCAMAGFVLIPRIGLRATTLVAVAVNTIIAVASIALASVFGRATAEASPQEAHAAGADKTPLRLDGRSWILLAYALSGFVGLAFEILWSRILVLVFGSTVYSFSAMLSVFLLGLALGGLLFARIADRSKRPSLLFASIQIAMAFVILLEVAVLDRLPSWFLILLHGRGINDASLMVIKFALSAIVLFPAAVLSGGTFPLVSRICTMSLARAGTRIGTLYAANTLGAIAGSLAGGFVLLRLFGIRGSLIAIASIALLAGATTLLVRLPGAAGRRRGGAASAVAVAAFALAVFGLPPSDRLLLSAGVWFNPRSFTGKTSTGTSGDSHQVVNLFYAEGVSDTVIVNETPTERCLSMSGKILATTSWEDLAPLKLLGHLPALVHPAEAHKAINIGLGIGGTVSALAAHPIGRIEVAELEPKVLDALPFFSEVNDGVGANPKVATIVADGRNLLSLSAATYDVISSDPNDMYMTGVSNLYSLEFFRLARSRLNPGGVMTQWIDMPEIAPEDFRSVVATFAQVFPRFTVWFGGRSLILIGSDAPLMLDPDRLRERIARSANQDELARLGLDRPERLVSFLVGDASSFKPLIEGASLNTDDRPFVEYHSARHIFAENGSGALRLAAEHFIADEDFLKHIGTAGGVDRETLLRLLHAKRDGLFAIADMFSGHADDAIRRLTGAVDASQDPLLTWWLSDAHESEGRAAQKAGRADMAKLHYETALRLDLNRLGALANLAQLHYLAGRYEDAEPLIASAYAKAPRLREILYRYGLIEEALGAMDAARRLLREAAEASPDSSTVLAAYAAFEQRQGRLDLAETFYRKAIGVDPAKLAIVERLAPVLFARGDDAEAERACGRVLSSGYVSVDCHVVLGLIAMSRGDLKAAEKELLEARDLDAARPEPHYQLARLWRRSGRADDAARELARAIELGGAAYRGRAESDPRLAELLAGSAKGD